MSSSSDSKKVCGKCKDEKKPIKAKGLCNSCYTAEFRRQKKESNKENENDSVKNMEASRKENNQDNCGTVEEQKRRYTATVITTEKWNVDEMRMHADLSEENIDLVEKGCFYEKDSAKLEVKTEEEKRKLKEFVLKAGGRVFENTCEDFTDIMQLDLGQEGIQKLNKELDRIQEKGVFEVRGLHIRTWANFDSKAKETTCSRRVAYIYVKKMKEEPFDWSNEMKKLDQKGTFMKADPSKTKVVFIGIPKEKERAFFEKIETCFGTKIPEFFEVGRQSADVKKPNLHIGIVEKNLAMKIVKWKFLPFDGRRVSIREFVPRKQFELKKQKLQKKTEAIKENTSTGGDSSQQNQQESQQSQSSQSSQGKTSKGTISNVDVSVNGGDHNHSKSNNIPTAEVKEKKALEALEIQEQKKKILQMARNYRRRSEANKALKDVDTINEMSKKATSTSTTISSSSSAIEPYSSMSPYSSNSWSGLMELEEEMNKKNEQLSSSVENNKTNSNHNNYEMYGQQAQLQQAQHSTLVDLSKQ